MRFLSTRSHLLLSSDLYFYSYAQNLIPHSGAPVQAQARAALEMPPVLHGQLLPHGGLAGDMHASSCRFIETKLVIVSTVHDLTSCNDTNRLTRSQKRIRDGESELDSEDASDSSDARRSQHPTRNTRQRLTRGLLYSSVSNCVARVLEEIRLERFRRISPCVSCSL